MNFEIAIDQAYLLLSQSEPIILKLNKKWIQMLCWIALSAANSDECHLKALQSTTAANVSSLSVVSTLKRVVKWVLSSNFLS